MKMAANEIGLGEVVILEHGVKGGWKLRGVVAFDDRLAREIGDRNAPGNGAGSEHRPVGDEQALVFGETDYIGDGVRGQEGELLPGVDAFRDEAINAAGSLSGSGAVVVVAAPPVANAMAIKKAIFRNLLAGGCIQPLL